MVASTIAPLLQVTSEANDSFHSGTIVSLVGYFSAIVHSGGHAVS
jgi:hypothetical protein